jgi:hypothetical protein
VKLVVPMSRLSLALVTCAVAAAGVARADGIATHALVVGSNAAGPGQTELRYAEDDARRVGALLTELGGYNPASVDVVVRPTPAVLRDRIARLERRVLADTAAGKQVRVFFYYSGHARATAIDLGPQAVPLAELRQRLFAVPATLTVVVLDACQSGAFSRVKGASPTADFSFNSRQQLDATGVAVLASSSGSELSQESEQLRSSYFTHHLLVGLRGAGDANRDGQVTVDEAYRYAYHQTLLATASTAVGGQHVTLEVDLKGHGEIPLSFPRTASAAIELPAAIEGHALVHDKRARAVIAETHKARGAAVRIAVAPGEYEVLVRQGNRLRRCQLSTPGVVELDRCTSEAVVEASRKGGRFTGGWRVELGMAVGAEHDDEYIQTLRDFGYVENRGTAVVALSVTHELWRTDRASTLVGGFVTHGGVGEWSRQTELAPLRFDWTTTVVGVAGRLEHASPISHRLYGFAEAGVGMGIARTRFLDQDDVMTRETYFGLAMAIGGGIGMRMIVPQHLDFTLGLRYSRAPVIENAIGQTHDSGGVFVGVGLAYRFGGSP